jgi:hypothetical protein
MQNLFTVNKHLLPAAMLAFISTFVLFFSVTIAPRNLKLLQVGNTPSVGYSCLMYLGSLWSSCTLSILHLFLDLDSWLIIQTPVVHPTELSSLLLIIGCRQHMPSFWSSYCLLCLQSWFSGLSQLAPLLG